MPAVHEHPRQLQWLQHHRLQQQLQQPLPQRQQQQCSNHGSSRAAVVQDGDNNAAATAAEACCSSGGSTSITSITAATSAVAALSSVPTLLEQPSTMTFVRQQQRQQQPGSTSCNSSPWYWPTHAVLTAPSLLLLHYAVLCAVLCLQGKVRDTYDLGDRIVVITTDRQSAFDRLLASIPFKGQVLNQTAAWWFTQTRHIVDNAVLDVPDPNVVVMQKCSVFPVEFVVRGFMTGEGAVVAAGGQGGG